METNLDLQSKQQQLFWKTDNRFKFNTSNVVKVEILDDWYALATIPTKANKSDAGWDLYSVEELVLLPGKRHAFHTGIAFEIPDEFVGLIWPRSGMSVNKGVDVLAGVIDSGYRGEIKVCLLNTGEESCKINKGDRIAQILFQQVPNFDLISSEVNTTARGKSGFGSSGS